MAHFAELDANNTVLRVVIIPNDKLVHPTTGFESEVLGEAYCINTLGHSENGVKWLQTSYNGKIRSHYAGIGFTYVTDIDAFVCPPRCPSFVFNETTHEWENPVERPAEPDDGTYTWQWDEPTLSWTKLYPDPE